MRTIPLALLAPALLLFAGCVTPPAETLDAAAAADVAAAAEPSVRVEKGKLAHNVIVCGTPVGCVAPPVVTETRQFPIEGAAEQTVILTLTWAPESPRGDKLRLQVRETEAFEVLAASEGGSPLVLEFPLADAQGAPLEAAVSFPSVTAGPATAQVRHDQSFELTIELR